MKIATNIFNSPATTGPGKFARRLRSGLQGSEFSLSPENTLRDADLYFASAMFHKAGVTLCKQKGISTVLRVDGPGSSLDRDGVHTSHNVADVVIYQSEYSKRSLQSLFSHIPPVSYVIHNGAEMPDVESKERPADGVRRTWISVCGNWQEFRYRIHLKAIYNNLDWITAEFPEFHWQIVGNYKDFKAVMLPPDMMKYVEFIPFANPAKLHFLRCEAYGCIHMVEQDSCPNSMIESMAYGLPILACRESAGPEIIGETTAGRVVRSYDSLDVIVALGDIEDNYNEISQSAIYRARKHFNIKHMASQYKGVFASALS